MSTPPLVSIIVPVNDGDDWIGDALHSCTSQSLPEVEIICVQRTEGSGGPVTEHARTEPRIRIIRQARVASAPEARRLGVMAAAAPYVLFLDAGDELAHDAARQAYQAAKDSDADLVEFGTVVVGTNLRSDHGALGRLHPEHPRLQDENILRELFPEDTGVDGRISRYLFRTETLRTAYEMMPDGSAQARTDDLPLVFLVCGAARTYVSLPTPLYRHHPGRDAHAPADSVAAYRSAVGAIEPLTAIEPAVRKLARNSRNPEPLMDGYESASLALVGRALNLLHHLPDDIYPQEASLLYTYVSAVEIVVAAATFAPAALPALAERESRLQSSPKHVRSVMLAANSLATGSVSSLLISQARVLLDAGYRVTIATHETGGKEPLVPHGVTLVHISPAAGRHRLTQWAELCRENEIDVVFDHRIAYSRDWPEYALAARASRAATIGWIPNFADPTYFLHDVHSLLRTLHGSLAQLVVTSPIDVAFWKMRGIENVAYLPTPPSPCFRDSAHSAAPKAVPNGRPLEIVWWGRLEERTKRVTQLLEVAAVLDRLGLKFRLRIIGPDSSELTAGELAALVSRRGLDALVDVVGPRQSQDLLDAADSSDIFISTSIIEGYLLAVPEAQSRGLPVLMYDLPWLLPVHDDSGVITVAPPDPDALAHAIAALVEDEGRYATLSRASIATAERALSLDFASLYMHLFSGTLPAEFSPDPTLDDGQRALNLLIFSAEESGDWRAPSRRRGSSRRTRRNSQRSLGRRVERVLTPFGHQVLNVAPWLRPVARQMKQTLLRH